MQQPGDYERTSPLADLKRLLASGIRISLIYGDSDYLCNWLSGNAVSLALASQAPAPYPTSFPAAGFADVIVNSSYVGGAVRQFGNLSFVRVYDSGHLVPAYQPETAFTIFTQSHYRKRPGHGKNIDLDSFGTTGPGTASYQNKVPPMPDNTCYVRAINKTCTSKQITMLQNGEGAIINGVLYDKGNRLDSSGPSDITTTRSIRDCDLWWSGDRGRKHLDDCYGRLCGYWETAYQRWCWPFGRLQTFNYIGTGGMVDIHLSQLIEHIMEHWTKRVVIWILMSVVS